jgi:hypothetical protein
MAFRNETIMTGLALLLVAGGCDSASPPEATAPTASPNLIADAGAAPTVEVFATGLEFPRNFTWGDHGEMYVAEAGSGGTDTTTAEQCDQVVPPIGPYANGPTARISRIDRHGSRTTVVDGLPSGVNAVHDVLGAADVAFVGGRLYALSSGGGCSHGSADTKAAVIKIGSHGTWTMTADLSAYQQGNGVANPEEEDFEPDGSWYSMISSWGSLVAIEPNHGEIVRVNPRNGSVTRIADISASQGHIVPTVVAERRGAYWVGNLGTFPVTPGAEKILRISRRGNVRVVADGFTTVLGLDFDRRGRLYVLEASNAPGFPTPNTGRVIRLDRKGNREVILDGLFFPTGMRFGPDGKLYIANKGFGPPQPGEILRVNVPGANDHGRHDEDMEQDDD